MTVRVLMLSWEYPPNHVGGLGRHVCHLGRALVGRGAEVTVITRAGDCKASDYDDGGVRIMTAPTYGLHPPEFITWAAQFNVGLLETAMANISAGEFDVVHAHDWIVAYAARALKHAWGVPLVATIHATEHGRQKGLHNPSQQHISETEWWLCYQACRVVTCSSYMKEEVGRVFGVPADKVRVIPNGISESWLELRRKEADRPLVIFVGRLVPEKGPQVLVDAMADVLREFPTAELVLAGDGPMEGEIRRRIYQAGLGRVAALAGRLDDKGLARLYERAWVAAFPSSYEPFGIVALEAMATGVPCIAGDAGGLREVVRNGETGILVRPDDPDALAFAVKTLLRDRSTAASLAREAKNRVARDYSWDDIAERTLHVYREAMESARAGAGEVAVAGSGAGVPDSSQVL